MRGAWQWPTFVVLTVVDAVLCRALPFQATARRRRPGVLLAGFFNLIAVAVLAPPCGLLLRRRRRDLPR